MKTPRSERQAVEEAYTGSRYWRFSFEDRMEVTYNFPTTKNHGYEEIRDTSPHTISVCVPGITSSQLRENIQVRSWNLRGGGLGRERIRTQRRRGQDNSYQTLSNPLSDHGRCLETHLSTRKSGRPSHGLRTAVVPLDRCTAGGYEETCSFLAAVTG